MNQPQRPTPQQIESEIRARLREKWIHPNERRRLRRVLVLQRGVKRRREEQARRLSTEQLLNNWAACPPEHPDKLVDLSSVADHQLSSKLLIWLSMSAHVSITHAARHCRRVIE